MYLYFELLAKNCSLLIEKTLPSSDFRQKIANSQGQTANSQTKSPITYR